MPVVALCQTVTTPSLFWAVRSPQGLLVQEPVGLNSPPADKIAGLLERLLIVLVKELDKLRLLTSANHVEIAEYTVLISG